MMPMTRLPPAIISIVVTSTNLRPRRSAIRPNTMPPSGRIRNPTAKTASVDNSAETGLELSNTTAAMNGANTA